MCVECYREGHTNSLHKTIRCGQENNGASNTAHSIVFCLFVFSVFFVVVFSRATDQQYGIRTNLDNLKLHGHTNEHVQFEGAHQKINRSLLPCRHTDNDKCIGILGMHPCLY